MQTQQVLAGQNVFRQDSYPHQHENPTFLYKTSLTAPHQIRESARAPTSFPHTNNPKMTSYCQITPCLYLIIIYTIAMSTPEGQRHGDGKSWENRGLKLAKTIEEKLPPSLRVEGNIVISRVGPVNIQYCRVDLGPEKSYRKKLFQAVIKPTPLLTIVSNGGLSPIENIDDYQRVHPDIKKVSKNRIARRYSQGLISRDLLTFNPPEGWLLGAEEDLEDVQDLLTQSSIKRYQTIEEYEATIAEWQEIPRGKI